MSSGIGSSLDNTELTVTDYVLGEAHPVIDKGPRLPLLDVLEAVEESDLDNTHVHFNFAEFDHIGSTITKGSIHNLHAKTAIVLG